MLRRCSAVGAETLGTECLPAGIGRLSTPISFSRKRLRTMDGRDRLSDQIHDTDLGPIFHAQPVKRRFRLHCGHFKTVGDQPCLGLLGQGAELLAPVPEEIRILGRTVLQMESHQGSASRQSPGGLQR